MKCANCGAEVREGVPFCSECGRPLHAGEKPPKPPREKRKKEKAAPERVPTPEIEEKPKRKKRKWKLILALVILALLLGAAGFAYLRMPAFRLQRALNGADYTAAAKLYSDEVKDSFFERLLTSMLIKDEQLGSAADAYFVGELTYEEAKAFYTAFSDGGSKKLQAAAVEYLEQIENDHAVRELLRDGEQAMEDKDYIAAMEAFSAVPEDSTAYDEAQKRLADAREAYVTDVCDGVDKLVGNGKYAKAMGALNEALELLPDDETLKSKRATVGTAFEAIELTLADDLIAEKDYGEAADQLAHALELMPESKKLADKLDEVQQLTEDAEKAKKEAEEADDESEEDAPDTKPTRSI